MQMRITEEERVLLEAYRASSDTDRGNLVWMAKTMARAQAKIRDKGAACSER